MTVLEELLGQISPAAFLEQHYLKLPLARSTSDASWIGSANWAAAERLFQHPQADILIGRRGEQPPDGTRPGSIREVLDSGYTVGLRHVDRYDAELTELAKQFHDVFAAPIDIHLYCTPAKYEGFGWHYDAEEVFVLQTHGSKNWWLRKNTVNPWPLIDQIPRDQRYGREIMPVMHSRLDCGDWLYIPAGYWHKTQAETDSISLSVGIRAWTALDVFDVLRPLLADSMLWRQRLPCFGAHANIENASGQWQDLLNSLGEDLAQRFKDSSFAASLPERLKERFAPNECSGESSTMEAGTP